MASTAIRKKRTENGLSVRAISGTYVVILGIDMDQADCAVRVAAYEFHYKPVLVALKAAKQRGVDVKVVFDNRKKSPGDKNVEAVRDAGISSLCTRRESNKSAISHNKFIVRIKGGVPEAVLTGGTNFSQGGIFGHSNVSHVVEERTVAAEYLRYWDLLNADPPSSELRPELTSTMPLPTGLPPVGTTSVFSPRSKSDALEYYAELGMKANDGLFATFAFGMNDIMQGVYQNSTASLRYAVMEKKTRPMKVGPLPLVRKGHLSDRNNSKGAFSLNEVQILPSL